MTPAKIAKLIKKYGRELSLVSKGTVPIDAEEPWRGDQTVAPVSVYGVMLDPVSAARLGSVTVYEDLRRSSDRVYAVDPVVNVKDYDEIVDGLRYGIDMTHELRPGTTRLLWYVGASR